ncbi:MAG: cation transporter [Calditrichaeota bacterium]|nr:cation transporter [Calditrichota bacterium]
MVQSQRKLGYFEGWLSAGVNTVLFGIKLWAGTLTGSVAMIADAWHTLSDTLTSGIVILGTWISGKPADEGHPFGHGRAESIAAIVISTLLAIVGVKFFSDSIKHFLAKDVVVFGLTSIIVFLISAIIKEALAQFAIRAGKKLQAQSVIADGWHHRSDSVASFLIVVGAFLGRWLWWIDAAMGIIVSILILKAAYDIFRSTSDLLIGRQLDHSLEGEVRQIIAQNLPGILDAHHFHLHEYGSHRELTFHVSIDGESSLQDAHRLVDELEKLVSQKLDMEVTIHIEPV